MTPSIKTQSETKRGKNEIVKNHFRCPISALAQAQWGYGSGRRAAVAVGTVAVYQKRYAAILFLYTKNLQKLLTIEKRFAIIKAQKKKRAIARRS